MVLRRCLWACAALLACAAAMSGSCDRVGGGSGREVVVYCSADAPVAQPVFDAFEKESGIRVRAVFDTEATKTTGLVNRLLGEAKRAGRSGGGGGVADVWWSSEPFGTIRLARAGVLERYESASAARPWPGARGAGEGAWYGFSRRVRVIVYNTKHVQAGEQPPDWMGLAEAKWKGRVGMARPQFGTTRGHMAAVHAVDNGATLRRWLGALAANDLRLYDGNAGVARAVGSGELYVGLTDSDDAIIGVRQGWPIGIWLIGADGGPAAVADEGSVRRIRVGAMEIPNTTAIVKGGSNPAEARALVDYLLSARAGELLSRGEFAAMGFGPTRIAELSGGSERGVVIEGAGVDFEAIADHIEPAMKVCDEVLRGR